ncbi:hypothetical protein [Aeromicrobium sp.]|uniref:hypothetical protein n=1 Tax=Aeromicrobium sp. TaxID=1871063 RepID=UPI002FC58DB6
MPNVVTPFSRKRHTTAQQSTTAHPRHRRDGYFDEQDQWHDSSETSEPGPRSAKG